MMTRLEKDIPKNAPFLKLGFLVWIFLFFLSLGSDTPSLLKFRYVYGVVFCFFCLIDFGRARFRQLIQSWTVWFLFALICFEGFRLAGVGAGFLGETYHAFQKQYVTAPLVWFFLFLSFVGGYSFFTNRKSVTHFCVALASCGMFLAMMAIPQFIDGNLKGAQEGLGEDGGFFPALFYSNNFCNRYIFEKFAHTNYVGDVMAAGFFAALGLAFYQFQVFYDAGREKKRMGYSFPWNRSHLFLMPVLICLVILAAVFLLFSRGTIISLLIAFLVFFLMIVLKFGWRGHVKFLVFFVGIAALFGAWSANLAGVFSELKTLQQETRTDGDVKSFDTNREGAKRAVAIYRDYPLWGVGTRGYRDVSPKYRIWKLEEGQLDLADLQVMCHYLQVLSEEGVGAFIYYLMLLSYVVFVLIGLKRAPSRFQFVMGASLFSFVMMVLTHAVFNHLMERLSMGILVYAAMGVGLRLVRDDFNET